MLNAANVHILLKTYFLETFLGKRRNFFHQKDFEKIYHVKQFKQPISFGLIKMHRYPFTNGGEAFDPTKYVAYMLV